MGQENIPSQSDLPSIHVLGYQGEIRDAIFNSFEEVFNSMKAAKFLPSLEGVTIGDDYIAALKHTCSRLDLPEQYAAPTSNSYGKGIAMTIPFVRDGKLISYIVFGPMLLNFLSGSNHQRSSKFLDTILHEFGHAADFYKRFQAFGDDMLVSSWTELEGFSVVDQFLLKLCLIMWEEYFASRLGNTLSKIKPNKGRQHVPRVIRGVF